MFVNVKNLLFQENEELSLQGEASIPCLAEDFQGFVCRQPVAYDLKVLHLGKGKCRVHGKLSAQFHSDCVHCLKPSALTLQTDFSEEFLPLENKRNFSEDAFDAFQEETYTYRANLLELDKMFSDVLLPLLPLVMLCQEDCKGLCTSCGENLNLSSCACTKQTETKAVSPFAVLLNLDNK